MQRRIERLAEVAFLALCGALCGWLLWLLWFQPRGF